MNIYEGLSFNQIIDSAPKQNYNIKDYWKILSPQWPSFLDKYIQLPLLQRLAGIGLLCGSDWTKLFHNRFYYSRLDHSIGVALIVWHFTKDKAQTIAGLLHDISTPTFSHVSDFRKGDALTQTSTEAPTARIIRSDTELQKLLASDNLTSNQVEDYHLYPIADNEIPQLSADRLEYMFPSGMALEGSWTMQEIENCYNDLSILQNEDGQPELGFNTLELAELYCKRFCTTGHILQMNEDKLTLHMMGQIMNNAVEVGLLKEEDFMTLSEAQIIQKIEESFISGFGGGDCNNRSGGESYSKVLRLYKTFRTMEKIERSDVILPPDEYFCVNLKVKQRYINPLIKYNNSIFRLSQVSPFAKKIIDDFLEYHDTKIGYVKLI